MHPSSRRAQRTDRLCSGRATEDERSIRDVDQSLASSGNDRWLQQDIRTTQVSQWSRTNGHQRLNRTDKYKTDIEQNARTQADRCQADRTNTMREHLRKTDSHMERVNEQNGQIHKEIY